MSRIGLIAVMAMIFAGVIPTSAQTYNPFIIFEPFHANGLYKAGEHYGWIVRAPIGMSTQYPLLYNYTVKQNNLTILQSGKLDLSSSSAIIEGTLNEAGVVYVRLEPDTSEMPAAPPPPLPSTAVTAPGGAPRNGPTRTELDTLTVGAAVDPTRLKLSVPRPADFDSFWAGKLQALAQVPVNAELTPMLTKKSGVDLFKVKLDSLGSHVQGYLATPSKGGKHPALVMFQYAGVYALNPATAANRAAEGWLTFNVDSHDKDPAASTGAPRNYTTVGDNDRESSYFLAMYLRDTRAIDYIRSRPDWDGKTIVVMGTSMGGQQSVVTAGLNPTVTAMIVNVPAGMDVNGEKAGRRPGFPNWPADDPVVMQTGQYFDPVNFASHIKASALMAFGLIDTTSPPAGVFTAFNQIPGPKEAIPMVESDHNNVTPQKQGAYLRRSKEVLDTILKAGKFTPNVNWEKQP
jgi:cephalosporin-C deacetylase